MSNSYYEKKEATLVEALDRVLHKGAVVTGDIVISVADIDLVYIGLRVLVSSVETMEKHEVARMKEST